MKKEGNYLFDDYMASDLDKEKENPLDVSLGSFICNISISQTHSFHDWCNKGRGMCYPVCGMMHIKEPLLLIEKSSLCGGSGFPLSLSEWFFAICLTSYNRK